MVSILFNSTAVYIGALTPGRYSLATMQNLVKGKLSLAQISDTHHVIRFNRDDGDKSRDCLAFDLEDGVEIRHSDRVVIVKDIDSDRVIVFIIPSADDISFLKDLVEACRYLCTLTLRMKGLLRDYYYSGVYSAIEHPEETAILNDNITSLLPIPQIFHTLALAIDDNSIDEATRCRVLSTKCTFCLTEKRNAPFIDYFIHPYVPSNYQGEPLAMCDVCLQNWQIYREKASSDNELILEGEENEELCGLCSDTPQEIVMCSSCVRSFCEGCLRQILSSEELIDMQENPLWKCMICSQGVLHTEPVPRARWTRIEFEKPAHSPYNIVPYPVVKMHPLLKMPKPIDQKQYKRPKLKSRSKSESASKSSCISLSVVPQCIGEVKPKKPSSSSSSSPNLAKVPKPIAVVDPPDEFFFFSQYVSFITASLAAKNKRSRLIDGSEDCCFLCKDGGDLVECEHACGKDSCLKVYHEGCLAFKVSDDVMKWICPRHYCDVCGSTIVILACIYCPMSVCENCKGAVATKLDRPRYILLQPLGLFQRATAVASKGNQEVCLIICHTCIDLAERCVDQGKLSPAFFSDLGVEMSFCSDVTFSALTKKRSGVQSFDRMESATTESFITAKASIIKDGVYSETQHSKSMKRRRNNLDERRDEPWSEREVDGVLALLRLYPVRVRGVVQSISESELSDARLKPQVSVLLSRSLEEVREKMEEEFMVEGKAGDLSVKKPVMDTSDLGVMPLSMAIGGVDCLDEDSRIRDETGAVVSRASAVRSGRRKKSRREAGEPTDL